MNKITSQSTRNFVREAYGLNNNDLDENWGSNSLTASLLQGNAALNVYYTGSLQMANPAGATLTNLIPDATTGSLYLVGSGSETWIAFKDIKGRWRTMTASIAA